MGLIISVLFIALTLAGTVYLTACIGRFNGIKTLGGNKKWLKYLISFLLLVLCFAACAYMLSFVNAVIILLYEILFFLLFGGIMRIVNRVFKIRSKVNWQGWLSIACSVVYFAVGWFLLHHVWQKEYNLETDKDVSLKIALIADSHLGTSFDGAGFAEHLKTIEAQEPDLLIIAGDMVDDSSKKEDLITACKALNNLNLKYGVWFSYGNHDRGYYNNRDFSEEDLEKALSDNGINILEDEYRLVDNSFYIVGRKDSSMRDRQDISTLLEGADTSKYMIVIDHQPNDYENEAASPADLVLSGHTHGGQLFPVTYVGEWLGINDKTYGHENRNGTDFIVTSGISDWEIKFKTGTKSEYVIINAEQAGN